MVDKVDEAKFWSPIEAGKYPPKEKILYQDTFSTTRNKFTLKMYKPYF